MFLVKPYKSIIELLEAFPTEQSCINHLEWVRWRGCVISPFDETSKVYKCAGNKYKCLNTNKYFNVRTDTVFEGSKIPLRTWVVAIYLFVTNKRGISSYQLAEELNVTQKTAWFILSRLRYTMGDDSNIPMEGEVECDETFIGGKNKNRHKDKKVENSQGRSFKDKTPLFGILQRGEYEVIEREHKLIKDKIVREKLVIQPSKVKTIVIPDTKGKTIQPLIKEWIKEGSTVMTDEWLAYKGLDNSYNHWVVDHGRGQYTDGNTTTNRIENYWSHLKRAVIGVYYKVSAKHLQKYADERAFRFNNRTRTITQKLDLLLQNAIGKRLTYQTLVNG